MPKWGVVALNKYKSAEKVTKFNKHIFRSTVTSYGFRINMALLALLVHRGLFFAMWTWIWSRKVLVMLVTTQSVAALKEDWKTEEMTKFYKI